MLLTLASAGLMIPASNADMRGRSDATPVTLWMHWQRGDLHYGPNFIQLHTPCRNPEDSNCECVAEFKGTTSREFADYITSFSDVPVVYDVSYGSDGQAQSAKLVRVGTWKAETFPPNDGLLGVRLIFKKGSPGRTQSASLPALAACFLAISTSPPATPRAEVATIPAGSQPSLPEPAASGVGPPVKVSPKEQQSRLVFAPPPEYPTEAKQVRLQGAVVLEVLIGKDGNVKNVKVVSGHPLLAPAARIAVYQWQYRPLLQDGKPAEALTTVTVSFRLPQAP